MIATISAVFTNGVFKPLVLQGYAEGTIVRLSVHPEMAAPVAEPDGNQSPAVLDWERRLIATTTFDEWSKVAQSCPEPDGDPDFDVMAAINESRRLSGELPK